MTKRDEPTNALRINDVAQRVNLSPRQIYYMIARDEFPKPYKITRGINEWEEAKIAKWQAARRKSSNVKRER